MEVVGRRWKVVGTGAYVLQPTTHHLLSEAKLRGVALIGRAAVSKTVGWGFESLHPCQEDGTRDSELGTRTEAVVKRTRRERDMGAESRVPSPESRKRAKRATWYR